LKLHAHSVQFAYKLASTRCALEKTFAALEKTFAANHRQNQPGLGIPPEGYASQPPNPN